MCWGKLSTMKRATLSILFLNITIYPLIRHGEKEKEMGLLHLNSILNKEAYI